MDRMLELMLNKNVAGVRAEKNEMKLNYYDDLIEHIKDSQRIMK
jgi:hypothetical protein